MSSVPFDPYYKWLGIPQREQPANHYRLLGIELFENDPQVVEAAADRQMAFLRKYQSGEHSAEALKLLNEVSRARICLLKPETKSAYDATLQTGLEAKADKPASSEQVVLPTVTISSESYVRPGWMQSPLLAGGGVAVVLLVTLILVFGRPSKPVPSPNNGEVKDGTVENTDGKPSADAVTGKTDDKKPKLPNQDRPLATGDKPAWPTLTEGDTAADPRMKLPKGLHRML